MPASEQNHASKLKDWLNSPRLSPLVATGLSKNFNLHSGLTPAVLTLLYGLDDETVVLLIYVNDILMSSRDKVGMEKITDKLKNKFQTVTLGDAKFPRVRRIMAGSNYRIYDS